MVVFYAKLMQVHFFATSSKSITPLLILFSKSFSKFQHLWLSPFMVWNMALLKISFYLPIA